MVWNIYKKKLLWLIQVYNEWSKLEHVLHTACKAVSTMCWYIIPRGPMCVCVCVCVYVIYKPKKWGGLGPISAVMKEEEKEEKQVP
jgi:hypothetical protein